MRSRSASKRRSRGWGHGGTKGSRDIRRSKAAKARSGGPRTRRGWEGPASIRQVRASNVRASSGRSREEKGDEDDRKSPVKEPKRAAPSKTTAPRETAKGPPPRRAGRDPGTQGSTPDTTSTDGELHGPVKVEDLRRRADDMVVGERTVIRHAARYGIVRGMTWTVILSAFLFWLPVAGPAIAGYVGGRKAGGPLRAILAVAIPATVMLVVMLALSEGMGLVPQGSLGSPNLDLDGLSELPSSALPIIDSLEMSMGAWISSPPDVFFIMAVFAIVGGVLSSLRQREEETVIEKLGIPLGELKERILKEEADRAGTSAVQPPSRWHPHPIISGPVAAHDALNEMVEDIVQRVVLYLEEDGAIDVPDGPTVPASARAVRKGRRTRRASRPSPSYDDLVRAGEETVGEGEVVTTAPADAMMVTRRVRGGGGTRPARGAGLRPRTAKEAITGDEGDWEVVDTRRGRRPVRVLRSPDAEAPRPRRQRRQRLEVEAPLVSSPEPEAYVPVHIAEPEMHVEEEPSGWLRRPKERIVYTSSDLEPLRPSGQGTTWWKGGPSSAPQGPVGGRELVEDGEVPMPRRRNYERLPIVASILGEGEGDDAGVRYTDRVSTMREPSIHDAIEAESIAESAARELAEMARFEDGPNLEPEEEGKHPDVKPASLPDEEGDSEDEPKQRPVPRHKVKAKVKPSARRVKHPTGALRRAPRSKRVSEEPKYEEDLAETGVAEWEAGTEVEEEDLFSPRRLEDDEQGSDGDGEGPEAASDSWAEEERIAALVREREEWDRL